MKELAKRDNVYCKLSGMATEADHGGWEISDCAIRRGGDGGVRSKRMMFGSDWPVCLLR